MHYSGATQLLADAQEPRRVKFERMLRCVAVALPGQAGTFLWALKNAAPASDRDRAAGAVLVKLTTMSSTDIDFKSALHTLRELGSRSVLRGLRERLRGATTANEATALARELAFWKDGDAIEDLRRAVDDWQGAGHDFELLTYVYQLEGVAAGPFLAECFHRATAQEQRSILRSLLEQKTVIAAKEFMSEVQILQGLPDDDETGISARDYLRLGASS